MNELVRLTTQDVGRAIPITDTLIVSKVFGIEHKSLLKLIKTYENEIKSIAPIRDFKSTIGEGRKSITAYELTEEQFSFLIMLTRNSEKAVAFKLLFVKEFYRMKKELQVRQETRHIGISTRKTLTESIKNYVTDESNFKNFAYSTYTKLVYKKIIGKDVKKIKEERGVKEGQNVRDYFAIEELEKIQDLESKIATFIEFTDTNGKTDKEIYAMVKEHLEGAK
jgi:Rha family phage regulatory protein